MRTDRNRRLLAVTTAIVLVFSAVGGVLADGLTADVDADALTSPMGNGIDVTQTANTCHNYDYSAAVSETGSQTQHKASFPVAASVGVNAAPPDWTVTPSKSPLSIADYVSVDGGQVTICTSTATPSGQVQLLLTTAEDLSPNAVRLNYNITGGTTVPSNNPPSVNAGGPYSGREGSSIAIDGASASDSDAGDGIVSYNWTKSESGFDAGYSCGLTGATTINPSLICTDNGTVTLTLTVTDTHGASDSDDATVTVSNANPAVGSATLTAGADTCSVNVSAGFTDAGVNDTHTASVVWGDTTSSTGSVTETAQSGNGTVTASHSYATIGTYSATVTVTDDNSGAGSSSASNAFLAGYKTGGILQPINPGPPSSIFKWGSTIPVKIQVTNCNGTVPTSLSLYITIKAISPNTPPTGDYEVTSTSAADTGNLMRFSSPQYIYNLYTKTPYFPDPTATYTLTIHYGSSTGPTIASAVIGLRN